MSDLTIPRVMILGTDTEIGKTYQASRLLRCLVKSGISAAAYKPVASGVSGDGASDSDAMILWRASECRGRIETVCPQCFQAPLAPPLAAEAEGAEVDEALLVDGAKAWEGLAEFLVVEAAGGVLSPISASMTAVDLAAELQTPVVLVAPNRLGVVSQTLMAAEVIASRGLDLVGAVLNPIPQLNQPTMDQPDISQDSNHGLLARFAPDLRLVSDIESLAASLLDPTVNRTAC